MNRRMLVAVLTAVLVVLSGTAGWGMEGRDPVIWQFAAGTLGGYALGIGGAYGLATLLTVDCTGWECLGRAIVGAFIGYTGGTVLGATGGVWAASAALGVEGNLGLSFLGAVGGTGVSLGLALTVQIPELLWLGPPAAAAGATAGYNHRRER